MSPTGTGNKSSKTLGARVEAALFSGTGNTLFAARAFADELGKLGRSVSFFAMESGAPALPEDASLGLFLPVACFSTYPTAWRFIESLPPGEGRGVFLLATMGGLGLGMDGPIRRAMELRGYAPLGSKLLIMPGNYNNRTIPAEANARRAEAAAHGARRFARALAEGSASWGGGVPLASSLWARLAHTRIPWNGFYKIFPLTVNRDLCPERNIAPDDGKFRIGPRCQSCQRCVAFCPAKAIAVPGKPAEQYRGASLDELSALLGKR